MDSGRFPTDDGHPLGVGTRLGSAEVSYVPLLLLMQLTNSPSGGLGGR